MAYPVYYGQTVYANIGGKWISGLGASSASCANSQDLLGLGTTPSPLVFLPAQTKVPPTAAGNPTPVSYGDQVVIASPGGAAWSSSGPCIYGAGSLSPTVFTITGGPGVSGTLVASLYSKASTGVTSNLVMLSAGAANTGLGAIFLTLNPTLTLSASSATSVQFFLEAPYDPSSKGVGNSREAFIVGAVGCALASGGVYYYRRQDANARLASGAFAALALVLAVMAYRA